MLVVSQWRHLESPYSILSKRQPSIIVATSKSEKPKWAGWHPSKTTTPPKSSPFTTQRPTSPLQTGTKTSRSPSTTTAVARKCPKNVMLTLKPGQSLVSVTWEMPTAFGYIIMNSQQTIGTHFFNFQTDFGLQCAFNITVRGWLILFLPIPPHATSDSQLAYCVCARTRACVGCNKPLFHHYPPYFPIKWLHTNEGSLRYIR